MLNKKKLSVFIVALMIILPSLASPTFAQEGSLSGGYNFLDAVKKKNYSKVKSYLQKGSNVDTRSYDDGVTALYMAAAMKDKILITFLLDKNANPDLAKRSTGETPLMVAVRLKSRQIITMLLSQEIDVNIGDRNGETALYKAVRENDRDSVKALLKVNADWSIADNTGRTPLDLTLEDRRLRQMTKLLKDAGAEY